MNHALIPPTARSLHAKPVKVHSRPDTLIMLPADLGKVQETFLMSPDIDDVTDAILVWLPNGTRPTPEDFDQQRQDLNPTVFPSFGDAVEHAIAAIERGKSGGELPWIKVGLRIFDPAQVRSAWRTVNFVKGRSHYTP